ASSYVDLHAVLGSGFTNSAANGIWTAGDNGLYGGASTTYVVGTATDTGSGATDAILWTIRRTTTWPRPYLGNIVAAKAGLHLFSSVNSGGPTNAGHLKLRNETGNGWL